MEAILKMSTFIPVPVNIRLKDKTIQLKEDCIGLHPFQMNIIKRQAIKKTEREWLHPGTKGVKIPLLKPQQFAIVKFKQDLIAMLSPDNKAKTLLAREHGYGFSQHAFKRLLERVERLPQHEVEELGPNYSFAVNEETVEGITEALINSTAVKERAEWKGHPYLNYSFICNYGDRELDIVVNFELGILVVTMVVIKETGYYVREIYKFNPKTFFMKKTFI